MARQSWIIAGNCSVDAFQALKLQYGKNDVVAVVSHLQTNEMLAQLILKRSDKLAAC